MGEKSAQNCANCGAAPVVEDGLCQDCIELEDDEFEESDEDFDDEDDFEDDDDEEDDLDYEESQEEIDGR